MINLSDTFRTLTAPETGRKVVQLTSGNDFCYPLYYFIPSITKDEKYLIYHRSNKKEVQLHRLNLENGEDIQLTGASSDDTQWRPWCTDQGKGVLDHRSVLNVASNYLIYFNENDVHQLDIETLKDNIIFQLDDDRVAIGQNCVTPDGKNLIYIHHDRGIYNEMFDSEYWQSRHLSKGTALSLYNFDKHLHKDLVIINSPIHHVLPYDNRHVIFCHPTTENGMLLTDINGGWYKHMRTQDQFGGTVCHYVATKKGIAYEVLGSSKGIMSGIYNPFSDQRFEFKLPSQFGYTHTGCDPEGKLWFYENSAEDVHDMYYLQEYNGENNQWQKLTGNWTTYDGGQKAHFHPRLTSDRQWIIFTAGDRSSETNHIYLLEADDLVETEGVKSVF